MYMCLVLAILMITQRRNVAKSVGRFLRRLFVCVCMCVCQLNTITFEREEEFICQVNKLAVTFDTESYFHAFLLFYWWRQEGSAQCFCSYVEHRPTTPV